MSGFEVIIEALRTNVILLSEAESRWRNALHAVNGNLLASDDLGLLGKQDGIVLSCNEAAADLELGLRKGADNLHSAAEALRAVADDQERRQQEIVAQFGHLR
ncbi:hypothetical protein [Saccharopolyspora spinosa]|uniref:Excreted virulence factor EspC (Type VII ESX diderm) n=1 Tax=Saccharopolyspora spinosa TaxID=60894 RepID=A0A2N3XXP3_SACSN|nr:hypothetical protein [Saccharopolyspora spinosa]PKW15400.1 hypothetical protein A8926_3100 [Saccharopolyspora spinosa]